tara:strand:+ start:171 stop:362 length:192 start_codon:yes stop_codon:yes gene_type:complete
MGYNVIKYDRGQMKKMTLDKKNIKLKIDELSKEIQTLENRINEMSWQREKYQQFIDKKTTDIL